MGTPRARTPRLRAVGRALVCVLAFVLVLGGVALAATRHAYVTAMGNLGRIDGVFVGLEDRPLRPSSGPAAKAVNILVLGTDRRSAAPTTGSGATAPVWLPGAQRTDTVMVLHVDGDRDGVSVVSIPRDSWVQVPGYGRAKVNAAYSYAGPSLAIETVERLTGLRMDHLTVIDWEGLRQLTDEVGGVPVEIPETVRDTAHDIDWTSGVHQLDGDAALSYVRQRYGLPNGDLDRVRRQHELLRLLAASTLTSAVMTNPQRILDLLNGVTRHVSVDADWARDDIATLVLSLRDLELADVNYLTAPIAGFDTVAGQSIVRLDMQAGRGLWSAVRADELERWLADHPDSATPDLVR